MNSQAVIREILARLNAESRRWAGLLSVSLHGSMAEVKADLAYSDVDLMLVFKDASTGEGVSSVTDFFERACSEFRSSQLECLFRMQSGPMHPLRRDTRSDGIVPLSVRPIVFFHVSVFPLSFYTATGGHEGPSPLLLHTWSGLKPLVGSPISSLRPQSDLSIDHVLDEGLGIRDCQRMLTTCRRGYWDIAQKGNGQADLTWRETEFEDFEFYDLSMYAAKWCLRNTLDVLAAGSVPAPSVTSTQSGGAHGWLGAALRQVQTQLELIDSWLTNAGDARIAFTEDPDGFVERQPWGRLRSAALEILAATGELLESVRETPSTRLALDFEGRVVPIYVGTDLRAELLDCVGREAPDRVFVLTDRDVRALFDVRLWLPEALQSFEFIIEPGEASKSPEELFRLLQGLEQAGISSGSLVLAVGGGNVGNLGGVLAGLACRGVSLIHIPTSLVAQLDSSIGAKQAVNGWLGKNYFGLFHPPTAVLINPLFLASLADREILSGLTEAIKHGFCQSEGLVIEVLDVIPELGGPAAIRRLAHIVAETIRLKIEYMRTDPRESQPNQFLELGHKVGHAIEHLKCGELSHGECVAIGMIAESYFMSDREMVQDGTTHYVVGSLKALWGTRAIPSGLDPMAIARQLLRDNKRKGRTVPFSFLGAPQKPRAAAVELTEEALRSLGKSIERSLRELA